MVDPMNDGCDTEHTPATNPGCTHRPADIDPDAITIWWTP